MTRVPTNDHLAAKAKDLTQQAPPGSAEQKAWNAVCSALDATSSIEGARGYLLALTIPRLRNDALSLLYELAEGVRG